MWDQPGISPWKIRNETEDREENIFPFITKKQWSPKIKAPIFTARPTRSNE